MSSKKLRRARSQRPSATSTLQRQWTLLQLLPRQPSAATVTQLGERLSRLHGIDVAERTLQRELRLLSRCFPLVVDDSAKPHRWSWMESAQVTLPGIDPRGALMLLLVEKHLRMALPPALQDGLAELSKVATAALDERKTNLGRWLASVRVVPRYQPLLPPEVSRDVLETVSGALLAKKKVAFRYRSRNERESRAMTVSGLGLVLRDGCAYLIGVSDEADRPKPFALQRASEARVVHERSRELRGFDIDRFLGEGNLAFRFGDHDVDVRLRFERDVAYLVTESRLSEAQKVVELDDGAIELRARVADTQQLRAWILGFGPRVEVIEPAALRGWVCEQLTLGAGRYATTLREVSAENSRA